MRSLTVSAFVMLLTLVLLAGGLVAFVAVRSGGDESLRLSGTWQIGLVVHRGTVQGRVGQSISCTANLSEADTQLGGEMSCDLLGTSQDVSGFVFPQSKDVRLAASFAETTVEILADAVSPHQLIGSWEDSQGFAGRFVAIRDQVAAD